jgi:hypothetical protein
MKKFLPLILLVLTALEAHAQARTKIPGGTVVLQPGYSVKIATKTGAVLNHEDHDEPPFQTQIGPNVVPRLTEKNIHLCRWSRKSVICGRKVLMGIVKGDDMVTVTILGRPGVDSFQSANFFGGYDRVEEVGDIILMALSFEPSAAQ